MYHWLRNTHLFFGSFCFLSVLMYSVSSIEMAHGSWFHGEPVVTSYRFSISPENAGSVRAVARELMDRHGLHGELRQGNPSLEGYQFNIVRPGTGFVIRYNRATGTAEVEKREWGFMRMLVRIHETSALYNNHWVSNMWGAFTGIASVGLITLALTGIYLWFRIHKERKIGAVLLILSLGYSLTAMVLLRLA